jgi:hypothetical protein
MAGQMLYVQLSNRLVGPFEPQEIAAAFAESNGGDLVDPTLGTDGTRVTSPDEYKAVGDRNHFYVTRVGDAWFVSPQAPLPATTTPVANGWKGIELHRQALDAVDWFPISADYAAFVEEYARRHDRKRELREIVRPNRSIACLSADGSQNVQPPVDAGYVVRCIERIPLVALASAIPSQRADSPGLRLPTVTVAASTSFAMAMLVLASAARRTACWAGTFESVS